MAQITHRSPLAPAHYPVMPVVAGVQMASGAYGIRYQGRTDVMVMQFAEGTQVAGVFTRSLTASAAVEWCRIQCAEGSARVLVVNSGNSNAFTGRAGRDAVQQTAEQAAQALGCSPESVLVASTGVIGEPLPVEKLTAGIRDLTPKMDADGWMQAAQAIMTTDTYPKVAVREAIIAGRNVTLCGIAKGSGMIAPDMATMLGFIATDAAIAAPVLKTLLVRATSRSFNCITVDSDTSTSDTLLLFATGKATNPTITDAGDPELDSFKDALRSLCLDLALQIVKDGEGARKLITIDVSGAQDEESARRIGMAIANSPLIKTMVAGEDPNWGRLVMAVGKSGEWADRDKLRIMIGDQLATEEGARSPSYDEAKAQAHLKTQDVRFSVDVGVGDGKATVWTCDLTEEYIRINADYRS